MANIQMALTHILLMEVSNLNTVPTLNVYGVS